MAGSSGSLHENEAVLKPETIDRHRAVVSIMEELEAVDWYDQRAKATDDPDLRAILVHNRDEEKEHAMMMLEWLRRRDAVLSEHLKTYSFTTAPITQIERAAEGSDEKPASPADGSLGIGSLREARSR